MANQKLASSKTISELKRKIYLNDAAKTAAFKYHNNRIRTTKYTIFTFLPKSLYIQFLRIANVYFLISAIISSIGEISSISPVTSVAPLVFVLFTSMLREAFEDWKRYQNDRTINNQTTEVFRPTKTNPEGFTQINWKHLHVGDIIRLHNNDEIPADIILLSSSDETGLVYVETANLDGERNLKVKQSKNETRDIIKKSGLNSLKGDVLVEVPNQRIHSFKGILEPEGVDSIYLNYNNILLRGTHMKNTEFAYGLVIYTGHDTKLLKNQGAYRNKRSSIERQLNLFIIGIFVAQILMCLLLTILEAFFMKNHLYEPTEGRLTYLLSADASSNTQHGPVIDALITFASFLLLLNTMIPISLMVSLEVAKWFQAAWLEYDQLMWDGSQKNKVLNMLIPEDLGRVEYIFTDKTGTLTSNEMKFTYCSIDGRLYSKDQLMEGLGITPQSQESSREEEQMFKKFWLSIALCHDIVINTKYNDHPDARLRYQGSSPDEVELVSMAADISYRFHEKKSDIYTLKIGEEIRDYKILVKIDFSSDRKRMSIIAQDMKTNKLYLFCKGADSIILSRIKKDTSADLLDKTHQDLQAFSKEGLRTLVIGYKELDEKYFAEWLERHDQAHKDQYIAMDESQNSIEKLEDEIERHLTLLGVTALEDKLQEGVAETISDLSKADIKIWMLTGDKLETAENIGYATNLIAHNTKVFKVNTSGVEDTEAEYAKISKQIKDVKLRSASSPTIDHDSTQSTIKFEQYKSFALIIDGEAITYTFNNKKLKTLFIELIPLFRTVICCRSTPNQKAEVVTFVKTNLKKVTLAIGDGGNDVNMIQKADIGVGLFGKEGNQAAFASDYAFVKFFFLWRLILVHGRWSYLRTANFINFFFYKNLIFTLPQFWFGLFSAFSGQSIYADSYITCFNSVFTAVGPVYYAAQEQDINPRENETIRRAMPYVYAEYRDKKKLFSTEKFVFWWIIGIAHSIIVYFFSAHTLNDAMNSDGLTYGLWNESCTIFAGVFCSVVCVIFMGTNTFNSFTAFCYILFTVLIYFPIGTFAIDILNSPVYDILLDLLGTPKFWLVILLITAICSLLLYIPKQYLSFFQPSLVDRLQRDRNRRWRKNPDEVRYLSNENHLLESSGKFNFDDRIMLKGWYRPVTSQIELQTQH